MVVQANLSLHLGNNTDKYLFFFILIFFYLFIYFILFFYLFFFLTFTGEMYKIPLISIPLMLPGAGSLIFAL